MNYKAFISFFIFTAIILVSILSGPGCANIVPPQGGLRDSIPPLLISANPADSSRNFKDNKIIFTFDEFVEIQNIQENLMVSPLPQILPVVDYKLKTITVKLKDSLEANTTYSLNFGNAIKDYTEGNPLKDFTYTFSTGRYIDSLELKGKVVLAENGKTDTTLIVMLHTRADDSVVIKEKPRYVTRLDSKGNFIFKNLPPKTFYLYALKDDGGTRRYLTEKQLFAFADTPVTSQKDGALVTLYAYAAKTTTTQPVTNITINRNKLTADGADKRLKYQTNLVANVQDLLSAFNMTFDQALKSFDSSRIKLYTDTTFTPVVDYKFIKDSTNKKLTLNTAWKENTVYHVVLDKDFAEDSAGRKLFKTDTLNFSTKKVSEYGSLKLKFRNLDISKNPVLQIVLNETIYKSYPLTSADFSQSLFLPGEYELRILYDKNKNGLWDPGDFFGKHLQPELVKQIERRINVKPAWLNEFEIETPAL
jgi:hypothetical protein